MSSLSGARWEIRPRASKALFDEMADVPPLALQVLHNRGYDSASKIREFLDGPAPPHDPYLLDGMDAAVARLLMAAQKHERVCVYADYDVDGVSSAALLLEALEMLGCQAFAYIPDRLSEGYGLNAEAIDAIHADTAHLIVTADCGTNNHAEIARAVSHGMDVIVTDHHIGDGAASGALAVLNPNRPSGGYPFGGLAGVGVAYKLVQALAEELPERLPCPEELLDLVALGTVADIVPIVDENRGFVSEGLRALRATHRPGLRALGEIARRPLKQADANAISFGYAPRLNAAGRLAHARLALELLRATHPVRAEELARQLDDLNTERRQLTADVVDDVQRNLPPERSFVFAVSADYPAGIVGLAASKLADQTGTPAFVATWVDGRIRGSARAPAGVHLSDLLRGHAELLESWGGHAAAAGFTLHPDRLEELRTALERDLARVEVRAALAPSIQADCRLYPRSITWDTYQLLESLGPYGESHQQPRFVVENVSVGQTRVVGNDHLAMRFTELEPEIDSIWFGAAAFAEQLRPGRRVDAAFRLNLRSFRGSSHVQMLIDDIRLPSSN